MLLSVHVDPLRAAGRHLTIGTVRGRSLREVLAGGDGARAAIIRTACSVRVRLLAVTILRSHEVRLRVLLAVNEATRAVRLVLGPEPLLQAKVLQVLLVGRAAGTIPRGAAILREAARHVELLHLHLVRVSSLGLGSGLRVQLLELLRLVERLGLAIHHVLIFVVLRGRQGRSAILVQLCERASSLANVLSVIEHLGRALAVLTALHIVMLLYANKLVRDISRIFCFL